ncbi:MAG: phosphoenolpyruvate--protein phosphotransferase, partial [Bacteroidetes bacterium]|nr:phosphoenolpyruvate--protein phosphotransferase [Bacteroidota bacterium]
MMDEQNIKKEIIVRGIPAAPGIAIGPVYVYTKDTPLPVERPLKPEEVDPEIDRLMAAIAMSEKELTKILDFAKGRIGDSKAKIFEAQIMILQDSLLLSSIIKRIRQEHLNGEFIVHNEIGKYEKLMMMAHDDYMHERAHDVDDLKNRIIRNMQANKLVSKFDSAAIVVAHNLTPADTMILSRNNVLGYATDKGGITSHAAILSRALKIPAVLGLDDISRRVATGDLMILDGYSGTIIVHPTADQTKEYEIKRETYLRFESTLAKFKSLPAKTKDGRKIELAANIEFEEELEHVILQGADGVGLYRTESLLIDRDTIPSEEEQYQIYKLIIERIYPRKVIIRTFDIGGDKIAPHTIEEANPFLGWRGIRIFLDYPELLMDQLRAILRASTRKNVGIMFPMVSTVEEVIKAKEYIDKVKAELRLKKIKFDPNIQIGVMIEVPSAAVTSDIISKEVDFLSIGTNDLIQYLMAVDRGNNIISDLYQEFHPSVIRTIKHIIDAGHQNGKWVGMCGEMAGDPLATILLLGLELDEFSVVSAVLPEIKKIIRSVEFSEAQKIAKKVLKMNTALEVQTFLKSTMRQLFADIP